MIVEIYGLPGSGKTTLSRKIDAEMNLSVIKIDSKTKLIIYNVFFVLLHPAFSFWVIYCVLKNSYNFKIFYFKLVSVFMVRNAKYVEAQKRGSGIVDEGLLQNLLTIFEKPVSRKTIKRYMRLMPKVDVYLLVDLPEDKRQTFIALRGYETREWFDKRRVELWKESVLVNNKNVLLNTEMLTKHFLISIPTKEVQVKNLFK